MNGGTDDPRSNTPNLRPTDLKEWGLGKGGPESLAGGGVWV